ncbi:hypothetical protein GCM10027413_09590 [Conyzicola nivalis]|uniref:DUF1772 domain-containing protein n=1 Tax=Conyzicola nivalis TaxID=1477021 RepID=A0A916SJI4_9MICO|nr:anthrone oxygenase family protein [Conyzicola nivalis]GGB03004.1 hypothetical protein GCM10010979_17040 [Conyzicola nivalis]
MNTLETATVVTAAACAGVAGGVYFSFSALVLPALRTRAASDAVAAMRAVNVAAVRPPFMLVFFGGAVSAAAVAVFELVGETHPARIAGAALALVAFGITVVRNVPLNNALAGGSPDWQRFEPRWRRANHARAAASILAAVALAASLADRS